MDSKRAHLTTEKRSNEGLQVKPRRTRTTSAAPLPHTVGADRIQTKLPRARSPCFSPSCSSMFISPPPCFRHRPSLPPSSAMGLLRGASSACFPTSTVRQEQLLLEMGFLFSPIFPQSYHISLRYMHAIARECRHTHRNACTLTSNACTYHRRKLGIIIIDSSNQKLPRYRRHAAHLSTCAPPMLCMCPRLPSPQTRVN